MNIMKKIIAVQDEMEPVRKNKVNPHFKNNYIDKDALLSILSPILTKHGLRLFHPLTEVNGRPAIKMLFVDAEDGETFESTFPMPDVTDAQKMGGAATYYIRYTLVSFLGLESIDDDGNTAVGNAPAQQKAPTPQNQPAQPSKPFQPTMNAPASLGTCKDCGAGNAWSAGKQKAYCSAKCWLQPTKQEVPPPPSDDGFGQLEQIPS